MAGSLQDLNYNGDYNLFAEIQVSKLAPDVEARNLPSGTNTANNSTVTVVHAPNDSTSLPPNYAADCYRIEVEYPISSTGTYPDVELRFQIGSVEVPYLVLSGGYHRNLFPPSRKLIGGYKSRVTLGHSMRAIYNQWVKGKAVDNAALKMLGLKVPSQQPLAVIVKSAAGWGNAAAAIRPLTVKIYGDLWTDDELSAFATLYQGAFGVNRPPSGKFSGVHLLTQALSSKTVGILPGGLAQKPLKIWRQLVSASNNQGITTSGRYVLSNLSAVGGQELNVVDTRHDLGFALKDTQDVFIPEEFGLRFAESLIGGGTNPQIWVGWYNAENRETLPNQYTHGVLVSGQDNPFQYGAVVPEGDSPRFWPLPGAQRLLNFFVKNANMAPAVSASGLSALAANSVYVVVGGEYIQGLVG